MDAVEIAEDMLDAISLRAEECLVYANKMARESDAAAPPERGHLSAVSERWREAYHQLRMAQAECQRILDVAEKELIDHDQT